MPFESSAESYGATRSAFHKRRPPPHESRRIAADRRKVRRLKRQIAALLNVAMASVGISEAVRALAHKKGRKKLLAELHEAEAQLHHDIAVAVERAGGPRSPSLAKIRAEHRAKTAEQAAAEAQEEDKDPRTADANDAAASGVSTDDVKDASADAGGSLSPDDDHDASVSIDADTNVSVLKSPWFWGAMALGGLAFWQRDSIAAMFNTRGSM